MTAARRSGTDGRPSQGLGPTGLPIVAAMDVVLGYPYGSARQPDEAVAVAADPARALRDALRPALMRPPCVVAFSGGRDSSLLLAVAADLAARDGLEPPVAVTFRYPGDPAADESVWQESVVAHLRRAGYRFTWASRDITVEQDLLGPVSAPVLRSHGGPTFPPTLANTVLLAELAGGGALVTGNGGDEVLGGHRAGVLRTVWLRRGRGLSRSDWRTALICAAPGQVRDHLSRRHLRDDAPWLRPEVRAVAIAALAGRDAARPLRWDRSVRAARSTRAAAIGRLTRSRIVEKADCMLVEPLAAPGFVASYAAFGGSWRGLSRTAGYRLLARGLLPDAVIERRDKAYFNGSRFGPATRRFVQRWDGRGVDDSLVDAAELRAAWEADVPPAATAMLLQQAWLADQEAAA